MKTIYGSEPCFECRLLVKKLKEAKEKYKYIDINSLTQEEIKELIKKHGRCKLPIVIENEEQTTV